MEHISSSKLKECITGAVYYKEDNDGLIIVDGIDFIPCIEKLYWDGYLHPNEMGFLFYADSLEKWIKNK